MAVAVASSGVVVGAFGASLSWQLLLAGLGALTLVLAIYGWLCLQNPRTYRWLDSLDLAIHETGHLVFAFGGEFLSLLGGTLFQLMVPLAFLVALAFAVLEDGADIPNDKVRDRDYEQANTYTNVVSVAHPWLNLLLLMAVTVVDRSSRRKGCRLVSAS